MEGEAEKRGEAKRITSKERKYENTRREKIKPGRGKGNKGK